jgi:hypothetical protein
MSVRRRRFNNGLNASFAISRWLSSYKEGMNTKRGEISLSVTSQGHGLRDSCLIMKV